LLIDPVGSRWERASAAAAGGGQAGDAATASREAAEPALDEKAAAYDAKKKSFVAEGLERLEGVECRAISSQAPCAQTTV
jgi:hypothetical protein